MTTKKPASSAGTVGDDILTVHALVKRHQPDLASRYWPACGAGKDDDRVFEWLRRVNCPDCLDI
ncbi:hypothetical protein [Streptomyces sp. NPDC005955]|uniref:hypothetical protein n=1 Tax=Streptomyces sp. NPDC005955 TaxID=3364738 RepID=UPI0036800FBF